MGAITGSKYNSNLDVAEIAKLVRQDIKAAVIAGDLPSGLKVGVTIDRYSMGYSLDVRVKACPQPMLEWTTCEIRNERVIRKTANVTVWLDTIEAIVRAYSRRDINSCEDYYNVNFSDSVELDGSFESREREALGADPETVRPVLSIVRSEPEAPVVENDLVSWMGLDEAPVLEVIQDDPWAAWIAREVA